MTARFVPNGAADPAAKVPEGTTVGDVLDSDPNLQRGQVEALRTMYTASGSTAAAAEPPQIPPTCLRPATGPT